MIKYSDLRLPAKHRVCQPNVYEPKYLLGKYGGAMKVNVGADGKPSLRAEPIMDDGSLTPRPRR